MMEENEQYVVTKLKHIMEPMVAQLLMKKPDDTITFMLEYLKKTYNRQGGSKKVENKSEEKAEGSENESFEEEEDDEMVEQEIEKRKKKGANTRNAISAEAYGDWNKKEDFKPRVIPKSEEVKARIRDKTKSSFIFMALNAHELEVVVDAMEEKIFKANDVVIQQGDEGDNLYVIETGNLDCSRVFAKGEAPRFLKEYHPGEAFGELALLYNAPRAATIVSKGDSILWSLDRATFSNIVKDAAIKKREKYEEFLKSVKIFSTIEPYELMKIMDAVREEEFSEGTTIIKEGEEGNIFFLLMSGEAIATKVLKEGEPPEKVMDYTKGAYFGELSLIRNTPRAANVIAKTHCVCLSLDRHSFKRLLGPLDEILKRNTSVYEQFSKKI